MRRVIENFLNRDFWIRWVPQNDSYFRISKCARLLQNIVQGRRYDLLDVGCGPATLRTLLGSNVNYYGLDIAIHEPAPYLLETDFARNPISFEDKRFDIVVALGVFEFMGRYQDQKFVEISRILKRDGKFIMSYLNWGHFRGPVIPICNNVQPITELTKSLQRVFHLEKCFPASHHWRFKQPGKNAGPIQMRLNLNIPFVSSWLAIEYFFVCSRLTHK